jgi:hypothetical protein
MLFGGVPPQPPQQPAAAATTVAEELPVEDLEYRKLLDWRIDYLMRAGYDAEAAVLIAKNLSVDLHLAGDLLEDGCEITTALLILL